MTQQSMDFSSLQNTRFPEAVQTFSPSPQLSAAESRSQSSSASRPSISRNSVGGPRRSLLSDTAPRRESSSNPVSVGYQSGPSRNNSITAMPTAVDPDDEIRYTPTAHRISKAKKGKKVHVCEFGCGKVFTRAEHRKRHEANHRPEPLFRCEVEHCRKPFQRADLLTRHLERQHNIYNPSIPRRQRTSSPASSIATSSQANSPNAAAIASSARPSIASSSAMPSSSMAIDMIVGPSTGHSFSTPERPHYGMSMTLPIGTRPIPPDLVCNLSASEDSPFYSSDSCYSPISESHSHANGQPYLPQYDRIVQQANTYSMEYPRQNVSTTQSFEPWLGFEGVSQTVDSLCASFGCPYPDSVGISQSDCATYEHPVDDMVDSTTPTARTFVDRFRGPGLRAESFLPSALGAGRNSLVDLDSETLEHLYKCYWEHFHPLYPVVHRPTFNYSTPPPILKAAMIAIGAQLSPLPQSRFHSINWFNFASKSLATIDPAVVHSKAPTEHLQATLLLEILSLYRSRSSDVQNSKHFRAMYSSLSNDRERLTLDSTPLLQHQSRVLDSSKLSAEYRGWINLESRKRILLVAFIVDTQRSFFFQQPLCHEYDSVQGPLLPTSSSQQMWDSDLTGWWSLINHPQMIKETAQSPFTRLTGQCVTMHTIGSASSRGENTGYFTQSSLMLATHVPIHNLLIVAAESWLFARKVQNLNTWTNAKTELRLWVQSDQACKAVWHAGKVLRLFFGSGLTLAEWSPRGLHEEWCLYLAALACWAFGFERQDQRESSQVYASPPRVATSLQEYLQLIDVKSWKDVGVLRGTGGTAGLLEAVRLCLVGKGKGALVNEGQRVLERLGEGKGRMHWF